MTDQNVLHNIRILDFSWVLAGPYATRMLADFGAEVIKVQPPLEEKQDKFSLGYSNNWNRNKLGISLDLRKPEGLEIARKLVNKSDIIVENFSPRVMENLGLGYSEILKIKADIIYLSMSAMGHSGDWKDYTGFGPTVQAFSGITDLTTYPDHPPMGIGYSYADHTAALFACLSLLGALEYRRKTGKGQYIDLSQTETMTSLLSDTLLDYTRKGIATKPSGNSSPQHAPHGVYRCSGEDRWCAISVTTEQEWQGFKRAAGKPLWAEDERFSTLAKRQANVEVLDNYVREWTLSLSDEQVMTLLQREGVPAGKVQNAESLAHDPQLRSRCFFIELNHPELGKNTADASPISLSNSPAKYNRASPTRGQDNEYVYGRLLGYSKAEIANLKEENVI
jgi:benzylsuccinate CoA-transferase BbsF subunit